MSGKIGGAGSKSGIIGQTEIDYEEGEWTVSGTYISAPSGNAARYTRIGNLCTISFYGVLSGGSNVDLYFAGLPFSNHANRQGAGSVMLRNASQHFDGTPALFIASGTTVYIRRSGRSDEGNNAANYVDSGTSIWVSLTYQIA